MEVTRDICTVIYINSTNNTVYTTKVLENKLLNGYKTYAMHCTDSKIISHI